MNPATAAHEFDEILRKRALRTVFHPIVCLDSGDTVGYECLVRPPADSRFASADVLLGEPYRTGRVVDFDWAARASASRAALDHELRPDRLLFLNIEPLAMGSECPPDLWPVGVITGALGRGTSTRQQRPTPGSASAWPSTSPPF